MCHTSSIIQNLTPNRYLILTALVYAGIHLLAYCIPIVPFFTRMILPNAWLIFVAYCWHRQFGLKRTPWQGGRKTAPAISSAVLVLGLNIAMAVSWPVRQKNAISVDAIALMLLVPVAEELFFRGVLFDYFVSKTQRRSIAIIGTALIFGALHLPFGVAVAVILAVLGLCLAWLSSTTVSLIWPIVIHIGWNTLSILKDLDAGMDRMIVLGICGVVIAAFSAIGWITRNKGTVTR